jgi:hypothetical protein
MSDSKGPFETNTEVYNEMTNRCLPEPGNAMNAKGAPVRPNRAWERGYFRWLRENNPMQNDEGLREVLAPLILQAGVPLKAIATIGGIIELDAFLLDFRGGFMKANSFEELGHNFEAYEALVQRAGVAVADFAKNKDKLALIQLLHQIRADLPAFPSNAAGSGETNETIPPR